MRYIIIGLLFGLGYNLAEIIMEILWKKFTIYVRKQKQQSVNKPESVKGNVIGFHNYL